jgi:hypothetical protein
MNILCIESFCKQKCTTNRWFSVIHYSTTVAIFIIKPSRWMHALLLPVLSWSWTVLLPSDTHRKPITSITAVLLPFVTYLVTPSYFNLLRCARWFLSPYCSRREIRHGSLGYSGLQVACPSVPPPPAAKLPVSTYRGTFGTSVLLSPGDRWRQCFGILSLHINGLMTYCTCNSATALKERDCSLLIQVSSRRVSVVTAVMWHRTVR